MDDLWYKDAVFYEVHVKAFQDSNDDGIGDFPGLTARLDYIQDLGVDCLWLLPFYPSPLRDDGYDIADFQDVSPALRQDGGLRDLHRRGAPPRAPGDRGPRRQPHVGQAPLVPVGPLGPGLAVPGLLRLERHRPALPGRAHHLRGHGEVQLDVGPGGEGLLLAPVLQPPAGPELRQPGGPGGHTRRHALLARQGPRRLPVRRGPLPLRARGDELREPPGDSRLPEAPPRQPGRPVPRAHPPGRGQPVAAGRPPLLRGRRRVPHGLSLPADAAHVHGRLQRGSPPDHGHVPAHARRSRRTASGASSSGTTTS